MVYEPSLKSLLASLLLALWPLASAVTLIYFFGDSKSPMLWICGCISVLFSLVLLVQAVFVHRQKIWIDERAIRVKGLLADTRIAWSEIVNATIRERVNAISRTDRLLMIHSQDRQLSFSTSTLSPPDEEELLSQIRSRTRLFVQRDKPTI
jgi:hypothetical protein